MKSVIVLLLCSAAGFAVCVNGNPTVRKEYTTSYIVFIGKVIGDSQTPDSADGYFLDGDTYTVLPSKIFAGGAKGNIELFSENSSGKFTMQVGQEYLVFAYTDHGRVIVDNCGNSALLSKAKKAVAEVARLSRKP